jgi:hypothetical protein
MAREQRKSRLAMACDASVTVVVVLSGAMIPGKEPGVICWVVTALGFQLGVLVLVAVCRAGR